MRFFLIHLDFTASFCLDIGSYPAINVFTEFFFKEFFLSDWMSSEASHPRPFGILKIQRVFLTEFEECAFSKYFLNLNSTAFSDSVRFFFSIFFTEFFF